MNAQEQISLLRRSCEMVMDTNIPWSTTACPAVVAALAATATPPDDAKPLGVLPCTTNGGAILYVSQVVGDPRHDSIFPPRITLARTGDMGPGTRLDYVPAQSDAKPYVYDAAFTPRVLSDEELSAITTDVGALRKERDEALAKLAAAQKELADVYAAKSEPAYRAERLQVLVREVEWREFGIASTTERAQRIADALNSAGGKS